MRKKNNPDCCPCQSGCIHYCVEVVGYGEQSVSGLTVTLTDKQTSPTWTHTGTTDSDGKYCYTVTGAEKPKYVTVTGDHCSGPTLFYYDDKKSDTCSAKFYYCSYTITFTINPDANPIITSLPNLFATETRAGDEVVWTWCQLNTGSPQTWPKSVTFTARAPDPSLGYFGENWLYPGICKTVSITCGHDYAIDLAQVYFGDCFFPAPGCPKSCSNGVGPYGKALVSKNMQVRFQSTTGIFAGDEGSWITLTGQQILNIAGKPVSFSWDSGDRGPQGNYMSMTEFCGSAGFGCCLNNPCPYEKNRISYVGTRVTMYTDGLFYTRQSGTSFDDSCINLPCGYGQRYGSGCLWNRDSGLLCADSTTFVQQQNIGICCPCNWVVGQFTSSVNGYIYMFSMSAADAPAFMATRDVNWWADIRESC